MPNQAYFYWKSIRRTSKPALFFFMPNQASFAWKANSADSNEKNNTIQLNHNSELIDGK